MKIPNGLNEKFTVARICSTRTERVHNNECRILNQIFKRIV